MRGTLLRIAGAWLAAAALAVAAAGGAENLGAMELCGAEARLLMRQAGIEKRKIAKLCRLARVAEAPFSITLRRSEDELGYCRITMALQNNSTEYLNQLTLTSAKGRFEIFRFSNILPGRTGYASAKSRILLACDELPQLGMAFHWPASVRVGDRSPSGRRLEKFKPLFLSKMLHWSR